MAIVVPDASELVLLERIFTGDEVMRLFVSDTTPGATTVLGDFTECTCGGYSGHVIMESDYTVETDGDNGKASLAQIDFVMTDNGDPDETVYGYYVTNGAGDTLLFAERFSSSVSLPSGGGTISVTLDGFTLQSNTGN
jgi:hypothetical protein